MNKYAPLPRLLIYQNGGCPELVDYLMSRGFYVVTTTDEDVIDKLCLHNFDLCILGNRNSSNKDTELLRYLRGIDEEVPIIFVSEVFEHSYIIEAFNEGADDYVVIPFNYEELVCRIKALSNRCRLKVRGSEGVHQIGKYVFDTSTKSLIYEGEEIPIPTRERKVLALLCAYKNETLSNEFLIKSIWRDDNIYNKRSLDVHVCRLRGRLRRDKNVSILTVNGIGYVLKIDE